MIKFSQYFNEWLYDKDAYYANYKIIGKEGDFYTSVSTSAFFGGSIAQDIINSIETNTFNTNTTIVEIGAHHGYLLADIIQFIYTLKPDLLKTLKFIIVERFEELRKKQKEYLFESFGDEINLIFINDIKDLKLEYAYIVANEIFDAFAPTLVYTKNNVLQEAFVENHKIIFKDTKDKELIDICKQESITKGEVCLEYKNFISTINSNIKKFEFITFDYGDRVPRNDFSIRIYEKHKVFPLFQDNLNLKSLYKNSDITYDVNFAHLINISKELNLETSFKIQAKALIDFGILDLLSMTKEKAGEQTYLREVQKVKTLIELTGMGDRFKMLKISK